MITGRDVRAVFARWARLQRLSWPVPISGYKPRESPGDMRFLAGVQEFNASYAQSLGLKLTKFANH
jgi:hypothetical protein